MDFRDYIEASSRVYIPAVYRLSPTNIPHRKVVHRTMNPDPKTSEEIASPLTEPSDPPTTSQETDNSSVDCGMITNWRLLGDL